MWLRFQRIPEKYEEIDLFADDFRSDLLVSAKWAAFKTVDIEIELLYKHITGSSGRKYQMSIEEMSVVSCPFEKILFFVVVSHQCDTF